MTGREPFPGETVLKRLMAHMERNAAGPTVARPEVPTALEAAYQKMMAEAARRPPGIDVSES